MPKARRAPIEYTPQFAAGIFRPQEVVDSELAAAESEPVTSTQNQPNNTKQRTTERTNAVPNDRTNERLRVRHSFDIWQDQLLSLVQIQTQIFTQTGHKPKLGELVQEALQAYIDTHTASSTVRTNDRSKQRSNERRGAGM